MAGNDNNTALQNAEQDDSFGIGGDGTDSSLGSDSSPVPAGGGPTPSPASSSPQPAAPMTTATPPAQQPKVSGKALFLGNLLRTLVSGVRNAPGNPRNPFDRGFMAASPQNQAAQQANLSKLQSQADNEKAQASLTGMKALQYEYLLKRLPQDDQIKHMQAISAFKENLIKNGANVEAEGEDEKASDAQAFQMNGSDPRSTNHEGKFYSMPTMDADGKPSWDVVYVPNKDTLQNDFKWTDSDGKEQSVPAGTPISAALGKFVQLQQGVAQSQTKELHQQMMKALRPDIPDSEIPQTISWLEDQKKANSPIYQQNNKAADARIESLKSAQATAQQQKLALQRAGAQLRQETSEEGKDANTMGYAMDENGNVAYMSKADAGKLHSTFEQMTPADVNKDRQSLRQLNDVQMNVSKYRNATSALTQNVEHIDAMHRVIAGVRDEDIGKASFLTLGGAMSMMEQSEVKNSWNKLNEQERMAMIGYLRAKGAIIAYNKAITGSARTNKESLLVEMANLPTPDVGAKVALPQLDSFQENIDQAASGFPNNLPGVKTPSMVRKELETPTTKKESAPEKKEEKPQGAMSKLRSVEEGLSKKITGQGGT